MAGGDPPHTATRKERNRGRNQGNFEQRAHEVLFIQGSTPVNEARRTHMRGPRYPAPSDSRCPAGISPKCLLRIHIMNSAATIWHDSGLGQQ
jgi:hypothetical protein